MRVFRFLSLASVFFALTACNPVTPSQMSVEKIRIKEDVVVEMLDAGRVDAQRVNAIADQFVKTGKGKITLTVSYVPGRQTEEAANRYGNAYRQAFKKRGVADVAVVTVPVADAQYAEKIVTTYKAVVAVPPEGCRRIPGYQGTESLNDGAEQYQFGCEIKANISKMIADPSDLLGRAGSQDGDSRRSGAVVESFKAGTPNQKMQGMQASGVGN